MNKIKLKDFFDKWFYQYKKRINFSIINKPSKALEDSFNAGFSLSQKINEEKIKKLEKKILELEIINQTNQSFNEIFNEENRKLKNEIKKVNNKRNLL